MNRIQERIAKLIKEVKEYYFEDGEEFSPMPVHHSDFKAFREEIADIFEEEDRKELKAVKMALLFYRDEVTHPRKGGDCGVGLISNSKERKRITNYLEKLMPFNRTQFLKVCGVSECQN